MGVVLVSSSKKLVETYEHTDVFRTNEEELRYSSTSTGYERNVDNLTGLSSTKRAILSKNFIAPPNSTEAPIFDLYHIEIGSREFYILVYSAFILASIILTPLSRNLCYLILMKASKVLHNRMFNNILQAPMKFFDTNPSGN